MNLDQLRETALAALPTWEGDKPHPSGDETMRKGGDNYTSMAAMGQHREIFSNIPMVLALLDVAEAAHKTVVAIRMHNEMARRADVPLHGTVGWPRERWPEEAVLAAALDRLEAQV